MCIYSYGGCCAEDSGGTGGSSGDKIWEGRGICQKENSLHLAADEIFYPILLEQRYPSFILSYPVLLKLKIFFFFQRLKLKMLKITSVKR